MAETAISAAWKLAMLCARRERDQEREEDAAMDERDGTDPVVEHLRQLFAKVVQEMDELRSVSKSSELVRICSIAITNAQTAEMWAVRAATYGRAP